MTQVLGEPKIQNEVDCVESILTSIKAMLGINADDTAFDNELVIFINGTLSKLSQLGVGPAEGFSITGPTETWEELFEGFTNLNLVKHYIYIDVRLLFDSPSNAFIVNAFQDEQKEAAWRIVEFYNINHPSEKRKDNDND